MDEIAALTRATSGGPVLGKGLTADLERDRIGDRVTIFRTANSPCWYVRFNSDGRQFKHSLKTKSKKRATFLAKRIDAKLTLGEQAEPRAKPETIAVAVRKYLESQQNRVGATSIECYSGNLDQFVAFSNQVSVYRLDRVSAEHLEAFEERLRCTGAPKVRAYLKAKGGEKRVRGGPNRARTIRGKMNVVRQMIKWCVKRRLILEDPAPGFRLPRVPSNRPQPFTSHELDLITQNAQPPFADVFDFFRLTGLRNDELCWLMTDDVDPGFRFIHVREKKCPFTGILWKPKHGNERLVPLCGQAGAIAKRASEKSRGPWLFDAPNTHGNRPGQLKKGRTLVALKQILRTLNIEHGTIHTFRHNFCSFLANQNVSPFLVMKYMGHANLDIVMTYYSASMDDLLSGMAKVDFSRMIAHGTRKLAKFQRTLGNVSPV